MTGVDAIALIGFAYIFSLFLIAYFGDRGGARIDRSGNSNLVYALSLAVYCSSWTFYGAVGTAAVDGLDYLPIYLGPLLVFVFGYPLARRMIRLCKQRRITTISDFLSSHYGKSRPIAALVTLIAVAGSLPYIALQLKAVSTSYALLGGAERAGPGFIAEHVALIVAAGMALFTILFGARQLDASERHKGMILAVAFESVVKLGAILAVGYYAMYLLLDAGHQARFERFIERRPLEWALSGEQSSWVSFTTKLLLSMSAILLLPRQFQVTVVEARDHTQFKTAAWVMPVYLILTSVIVVPIALAGRVLQPGEPADMYVLSLPLAAGNTPLAAAAFIGGLSAATGMVIVAAVALSTMISNDLVMPWLIRRRGPGVLQRADLNALILRIRRLAICGLLLGAYGYYRLIDSGAQLANIGLVSFAATFQFLPAMLFALYWPGARGRGIFHGLIGGFILWFYTLVLPAILPEGALQSFFAGSLFHPEALFGVALDNPLTHGVVWSLGVNLLLAVGFSLPAGQAVIERPRAGRLAGGGEAEPDRAADQRAAISPEALYVVAERIMGAQSAAALFAQHRPPAGQAPGPEARADPALIAAVQTAMAGVMGTASAARVIADIMPGDKARPGELTHLVDQTQSVLQFNRNLLQTTLQHITHGIAVVDKGLNLVIWNDTYLRLFDYPKTLLYVGKPIREIFEYSAGRGDFAGKNAAQEIKKRLDYLKGRSSYTTVRKTVNGVTIKATGEPMPGGGFVTTYEDITASVKAARLLKEANEELENRVQARTLELEALTRELEQNTQSKTHFLAAASHDLLQPITAARLFNHSVAECAADPAEVRRLVNSVDQSLATANDLLRALLDISRLDAGGIQPKPALLGVREFLRGIEAEMRASANEQKVTLRVEAPMLFVRTDKQLLFSVLLNLVSNALRYSGAGGEVILRAARAGPGRLAITVEDSGPGIAPEHLEAIFTEFYQVKDQARRERQGLGLGLSIVRRICRLLDITVKAESEPGRGSAFTITLAEVRAEAPRPAPAGPKTPAPGARLAGVRALCLDNDPRVLEALETLLAGWGCEVTGVLSQAEAEARFDPAAFDIVLADYRLDNGGNGLDFLAHCRARHAALAGVLITAEQDKSLQEQATRRGFMYLPKPVEPAALKSSLTYLVASP